MKKREISYIIISNKSGRQAIKAKVIIDATGEGDIIRKSGAPFQPVKRHTWGTQISTLLFRMANVDLEKFCQYLEKNPGEMPTWKYGDIPYDAKTTVETWRKRGILCTKHGGILRKAAERAMKSGDLRMNQRPYNAFARVCMDSFSNQGWVTILGSDVFGSYKDTINALKISRDEMELRDICFQIAKVLKKYVPGFKDSYISSIATDLGIRSSLRIIGEYVIPLKEREDFAKYNDVVGTASRIEQKECNIPYRSLLPKNVKNLIVASGKTISTEIIGMHRNEVECMVIGQAAGTAGAMAAEKGISPKKIDIKQFQKTLLRQGVYLGNEECLKELGL